jgi:hypothetical protein
MSESKKNRTPPRMHVLSRAVRAKLAEAYAKEAKNLKWTDAELAEFARMAAAWEASLSQN